MVTIKDVAEKAGVSLTTVSRVLNRRGALSEKTIKRVEEAVAELGYIPNSNARALVGVETKLLGYILNSFAVPFNSELAQQIEKQAKSMGYDVLFVQANDIPEIKKALEYLLSHQVCGVLYSAIFGMEEEKVMADFCRVPHVFTLNKSLNNAVSVYSDDRWGGVIATNHLIEQGCKKLIHICGDKRMEKTSSQRTYSFEDECAKKGISYRVYQNTASVTDYEKVRRLVDQVFQENPDMDGMFLSNDILAAQCISKAMEMGKRIPEELKIVGYDGIQMCDYIYPSLTTIQQDFELLAKYSVDRLISQIKNEETPRYTVVPVKLITRHSSV